MSFLAPISRLLGRSNFIRLLVFLAAFIVTGVLLLYYFEHDTNEAYASLSGAIWAIIVFLASGFDYELPMTTGGRVVAVCIVAGGVGLLGLFTATITTYLYDLHRRRRNGMVSIKLSNHFLICGWNQKGPDVVAQLTADVTGRKFEVVIIAGMQENPIDHDRVHFVRGDATERAVLERANAQHAHTGIVLPNDGGEGDTDGHSLLVILALNDISPDLYVCVEVLNPSHVIHIQRAGADEIISSTELAANMLTQAAINHGISRLYDQILSNRYGHEVYKTPVPAVLAGKTVRDAADILSESEPITLLAIARGNELMVNPRRDTTIETEDSLLLLAERYPKHLF